jgi:ketosteroid isomerase-like protein
MEQHEIRVLLGKRSEAIQTMDIDRLMSYYSPDIIYFDGVPPLKYTGSTSLRGRFLEWFGSYTSGIDQEIRDLSISTNGDIAVASMLIRSGGTLKNGQDIRVWARATSCCLCSNGEWLITHEHVSLPVDPRSGNVAMDLVP